MRTHFRNLMVAGAMALLATPLSAERADENEAAVAAPVGVQRLPTAGLRDEAAMVIVGTALLGIAAAVRKAA